MTADGVNVTVRGQRGALYWLQVLVPNLILLTIVGADVYGLVQLMRR